MSGYLCPMPRLSADQYMDTRSGLLHWKDYGGTGPTILLVHGLGGSLITWNAVAPRLTRIGRVVALDLPGFGLSPPAADWRIETHVNSVHDFLSSLDAPVTLIGASMGGLVAEILAADHPELVSNLLLVSPATLPRLPDERLHLPTAARMAVQATPLLGTAISARYFSKFTPRELIEFSLNRIAHKPERIPPNLVEELVALSETRYQFPWAADAVPMGARAIAAMWRHPGQFVAMIRRITAPTLVVHGLEDPIVSPTAVEWLVSLRLDWELIQMEDTGHTPQLDAPVRFAETVTPWLIEHGHPGH